MRPQEICFESLSLKYPPGVAEWIMREIEKADLLFSNDDVNSEEPVLAAVGY